MPNAVPLRPRNASKSRIASGTSRLSEKTIAFVRGSMRIRW
jgi:hypothetical protein